MSASEAPADVALYVDPTCPFCWLTSKWLRVVAAQRDYTVEWRLISLRLLNAEVDYDERFPPEYESGHTAGLRLLRVAARTRDEHGQAGLSRLYAALGEAIFETDPSEGDPQQRLRTAIRELTEAALSAAELPVELADALDDTGYDDALTAETDQARALAGHDIGTPVLQVDPPDGPAFFGPVISRMPAESDALRLWDHVIGLARFPGFAELKRGLREQPQLVGLGVAPGEVGKVEEWYAGSRRRPGS